MLPKGFAPFTTVQHWLYRLPDNGMPDLINETRVMSAQLLVGCALKPTAGVIDSESIKIADASGPRGYDGQEGEKPQATYTHGCAGILCWVRSPTPPDIHVRDSAPDVIASTQESFPTLAHQFVDGGFAGEKLETAMQAMDGPAIEIVKRPNRARQWIVERTFAWLGRCRRLAAAIACADALAPLRFNPQDHRIYRSRSKALYINYERKNNLTITASKS